MEKAIDECANMLNIPAKYIAESIKYEHKQKMYLTNEQFLNVLKRFRSQIKKRYVDAGLKIFGRVDDCNDYGAKTLDSNIGLCNDSPFLWKKEERLFDRTLSRCYSGKDPMIAYTTISPKYKRTYQFCPFRIDKKEIYNGCFWSCKLKKESISPEIAIEEYDKLIAIWEKIIKTLKEE